MGRGQTSSSILYGDFSHRADAGIVNADGVTEYSQNGQLQKIFIPQEITPYRLKLANEVLTIDQETTIYLKDNRRHRDDGPAFIQVDGCEKWYFEGELHRLDGPAIKEANGTLKWGFNGGVYFTEEVWLQDIRKRAAA